MRFKKVLCVAIGLGLAGGMAAAADAPAKGKLLVDVRWRYEHVDDAAFSEQADAGTLRLRLGYQTAAYNGLSALVEGQANAALFLDDFNSTANGKTQYPVVADPNSYSINRAVISYAPNADGKFNIGRQYVIIDNQRFFGNSAWRQNGQTFDGIDLNYRFGKSFSVRYDYLNRVQRATGAQNPRRDLAYWDVDLNLFHAEYDFGPAKLVGYAYLNDNNTLPLTSQKNFGARFLAGKPVPDGLGWNVALEYAQQSDYADGSALIDADYSLVEGGLSWKGNNFKAGWEVLGGDGRYGFQTPYASLHAFNGWADKFTTTPVNGLQDIYLGWNRKFGKWNTAVVWHDFDSDANDLHYGSEWDASLGYAIAKGWNTSLKYADYQADDYAQDTRKLWLSVEYAY